MKQMNHQNIVVVTVTYKNRFSFIRKLIDSCLMQGVYKIIIVDNKPNFPENNAIKRQNHEKEEVKNGK